MEPIRVLQIVPKLTTGGGQKVVMDLAEHLPASLFHVEVVSLFPCTDEIFERYAKKLHIKVHYLTKHKGFDIPVFFEIDKVLREFKPHVVHNHLNSLYTVLPSTYINGIPVRVHTIHNIARLEAIWFHRSIQKIAFHKLNVVPVSISHLVKKTVLEVYGNVYSPVIYNGVDPSKYSVSIDERQSLRKKFGIPDQAFVFINVARLSQQKNQHLLLNAFKYVLHHCPSTYLLLVGDGELRQSIIKLIDDLEISNNVILTGNTNNVAQLLNSSDCFVLSSDWEGLPVSILEAMASSKPIIATNVGGVSELVSDCENGLLVPSGDVSKLESAMLELSRDRDKCVRMGNQGRKLVEEKFCVGEMAHKYGELYLELLSG